MCQTDEIEDWYLGVTSVAAEILGLADRIGSIQVGKEANLVLLDR